MGNLGTKYVLLGITMATILGVYAITTSAPTSLTATSTENLPYLLGHITIEVTDANGNIKSYQQTDNILTDEGFQCALVRLSNVTLACNSGAVANIFKFISLSSNLTLITAAGGDGSLETTVGYDSEVAKEVAKTDQLSDTSFTVKNTFTTDASNPGTDVALNNGETVAKTGLFDDGAGFGVGNMLAVADLSPTTVVTGDTIAVTWTIKLTGS